ncbi:hypothetical protein DFH08DRAFT_822081 [Mycena albidolilacea]|uniref:Uncharacterized protein n=1 Tax=Mycena albidolilacea TaxID=1033008 RepID=A0AAD6Z989_9AGAR|nr:hypothetical protein DFH08DRAFT_822081 [Mycena albidolilacea]
MYQGRESSVRLCMDRAGNLKEIVVLATFPLALGIPAFPALPTVLAGLLVVGVGVATATGAAGTGGAAVRARCSVAPYELLAAWRLASASAVMVSGVGPSHPSTIPCAGSTLIIRNPCSAPPLFPQKCENGINLQNKFIPFSHFCGNGGGTEQGFLIMSVELAHGMVLDTNLTLT